MNISHVLSNICAKCAWNWGNVKEIHPLGALSLSLSLPLSLSLSLYIYVAIYISISLSLSLSLSPPMSLSFNLYILPLFFPSSLSLSSYTSHTSLFYAATMGFVLGVIPSGMTQNTKFYPKIRGVGLILFSKVIFKIFEKDPLKQGWR